MECTAIVWYGKSYAPQRKCHYKAKFKYQLVDGSYNLLCGVHAKRFKDSPYLKKLSDHSNKR